MANKSKFMKKFLALLLFAGFSIDSGVAQTEDQLLKRFVPIFPEVFPIDASRKFYNILFFCCS